MAEQEETCLALVWQQTIVGAPCKVCMDARRAITSHLCQSHKKRKPEQEGSILNALRASSFQDMEQKDHNPHVLSSSLNMCKKMKCFCTELIPSASQRNSLQDCSAGRPVPDGTA